MFHVDSCGIVLVKSVECSKPSVIPLLVGALEHQFYFHSVGNVIIPTDELHHF